MSAELNNNQEILEAFEVLEKANFSHTELELYDTQLDVYRLDRGWKRNSKSTGS